MTALLTLLMACAPAEAPVPEDWYAGINEAIRIHAARPADDWRRIDELAAYTRDSNGACQPQPRIPDVVLFAAARVEPEAALVRACYGDTFSRATSYRFAAIGATLVGPDDDAARLRTTAFLATWPNVALPTARTTDLRFETVHGGGTWSLPGAAVLAPSAVGVGEFPDYVYPPIGAVPLQHDAAALKVWESGWYLACAHQIQDASAVLRCASGRCNYEGTGVPALLSVSFESAGWAECVAATDADRPAPVNTLATALEKRWTPQVASPP